MYKGTKLLIASVAVASITVGAVALTGFPVSYTHLTLPTN